MGAASAVHISTDYRDEERYPDACDDVTTAAAAVQEIEQAYNELPAVLGDDFRAAMPKLPEDGLGGIELEQAKPILRRIRELARSWNVNVLQLKLHGRLFTTDVDATYTVRALKQAFVDQHLSRIAEESGASTSSLQFELSNHLHMWYSGKQYRGELDEAKRLYEYQMRKQEVVEFKYKLVHAAAPSQADATLDWSKLDDNRQHVGGGIEAENTPSDVRGKAKIDKRGAKHKADRLQKRMSEKRKALPSAHPKLTPPIVAYLKTAFTEYDQDHNGNLDWEEFWTLISALALNLDEDAIGALWRSADKNGDANISLAELVPVLGPKIMEVYGNKPPTPEDWCYLQSEEGYPYWYNKRTGASQWADPAG